MGVGLVDPAVTPTAINNATCHWQHFLINYTPPTRPVAPRRDDYGWDASPGWVLPWHVDQFRTVS
jgi:hypothetical protein